jgi:hypothetical protein
MATYITDAFDVSSAPDSGESGVNRRRLAVASRPPAELQREFELADDFFTMETAL